MSYADTQAARDAAYAREYRAWFASQPPDERARLTAAGLDQPDISRRTSTRQCDAVTLATTAAPSPTPLAAALAAESDLPATHSSLPATSALTAADILASFCARIRSHPSPLLAFDAACFATGLMGLEGHSQTVLAARHGVTRAAFSKLAVQWTETFALPPSRGMRSKRARHAYRAARLTSLSQHHDHPRQPPTP